MCVGLNMKMCPLECSSLQVIGFSNLRVLEFLVYFTKKDSRMERNVVKRHFLES